MVNIQTTRCGLIWLAACVNDNLDIEQSWGFTQESATRRLFSKLDKKEGLA